MTDRKDIDFLEDIKKSTYLIENYLVDVSKEQFYNNQEKQDAVINRLMVIGEVTKLLSDEIRNNYPSVSWKQMAGMRDIMIHRYHGIDLEIVWETANKDIQEVAKEIDIIMSDLETKN